LTAQGRSGAIAVSVITTLLSDVMTIIT
jgi:hypothetical protein